MRRIQAERDAAAHSSRFDLDQSKANIEELDKKLQLEKEGNRRLNSDVESLRARADVDHTKFRESLQGKTEEVRRLVEVGERQNQTFMRQVQGLHEEVERLNGEAERRSRESADKEKSLEMKATHEAGMRKADSEIASKREEAARKRHVASHVFFLQLLFSPYHLLSSLLGKRVE